MQAEWEELARRNWLTENEQAQIPSSVSPHEKVTIITACAQMCLVDGDVEIRRSDSLCRENNVGMIQPAFGIKRDAVCLLFFWIILCIELQKVGLQTDEAHNYHPNLKRIAQRVGKSIKIHLTYVCFTE